MRGVNFILHVISFIPAPLLAVYVINEVGAQLKKEKDT